MQKCVQVSEAKCVLLEVRACEDCQLINMIFLSSFSLFHMLLNGCFLQNFFYIITSLHSFKSTTPAEENYSFLVPVVHRNNLWD